MANRFIRELEHHAPFTFVGAVTGIILMAVFRDLTYEPAYRAFYVLHPIHVFLSALVTASMYKNYKCSNGHACPVWALLTVGYLGSVGIATLSDSLIPYLGEVLLNMPHRHVHLGFIEEWWLVNPLAIAGISVAFVRPTTKFPHAGHVLISTWASLFHIIMARGGPAGLWQYAAVLVFLFLAVWLPCCISDIIFPLMFVNGKPGNHRE
ncbi:MAG: hypothetical protein GF409_06680 [Candidatus Omnitrophica bacterium]|nr:hypothetical protein [Candidatus Omnitrophota bacterium]